MEALTNNLEPIMIQEINNQNYNKNNNSQIITSELLPSERNKKTTQLKENPWSFLLPYKAKYNVFSDGTNLGTANRQLLVDNSVWKLQITSKLTKWLLSLKSEEFSYFKIVNKKILVDVFSSITKISLKKKKTIIQNFNWQEEIETGSKGNRNWSLSLKEPVYDRMTHILKLRADLLANTKTFDYLVSYKGKREIYSYVKSGYEKISTDAGEFETLKMNRKKGDDSSFSIWLCPELDYFPIKIAQFEQDKPDVTLVLSELNYLTEHKQEK